MVDDEPKYLQSLGDILKRGGYRTSAATSGHQALTMAQSLIPDLILLDVMITGIDGFEVCRQLKKGKYTRNIPSIFVSGRTETENIVQGFAAGAVDYILKPYNPGVLLSIIETRLKEKNWMDQLLAQNEHLRLAAEEAGKIVDDQQQTIESLQEEITSLRKLAIRDDLTNLYTRRFTLKRLSEEIAEARRYSHDISIILMVIDTFREINYRYGHPFAEEVMFRVAQTISKDLREMDLAGRYAGEEFLLILPHTNAEGAYTTAQRIQKSIAEIDWGHRNFSVTVSGAISSLSAKEVSDSSAKINNLLYRMIMNAGNLIYSATQKGTNQIQMQ
jgi:diguanylate cyclase (GGDEF)-like protein